MTVPVVLTFNLSLEPIVRMKGIEPPDDQVCAIPNALLAVAASSVINNFTLEFLAVSLTPK